MINAIRTIMIKAGELPTEDPRGTWVVINSFMEQEHRPQCQPESKGYVLWALVPVEASTVNPSEADIARRVELLQESCSTSIIVSYGIRDNEYGAIVAGKCYIVTTQLRHHNVFGDDHPTAVWTEASPEVFAAELRRVAIRQLLAEGPEVVGTVQAVEDARKVLSEALQATQHPQGTYRLTPIQRTLLERRGWQGQDPVPWLLKQIERDDLGGEG